jgi:hypothetical protein
MKKNKAILQTKVRKNNKKRATIKKKLEMQLFVFYG